MADIVISFAGDGEAVAGRLAAALAHRGYGIWSEDGAGGPIADRIAGARAAVILWSPGARASDWVRAEANYARGQGKLVQATIDAAPPPMPFDAAAAAPLAGWNGEPGHPGWNRVAAEVAVLCGPGAAAPIPPAPPATRTAPIPPPAAPVAARGGGGPGLVGLMGVLFLLFVGVGAFLWMRSGPPYAPAEPPPPAASRPAATAAPPAPAAPAAPMPPPPAELPPAEAPTAEVPASESPPPRSRPEPRPTGPRINPAQFREHAAVLRARRAGHIAMPRLPAAAPARPMSARIALAAAAALLGACNPAGEAEQAAPEADAPRAEAPPPAPQPVPGRQDPPQRTAEAPADPPGDYPGVAEMSAWQRRAFDAGYRDCRAGRYAPDAYPEAYRIGCGVAQEAMSGAR